jgi:hypothetical protein
MARTKHALTDAEVAELKPHPDGRERTYREFNVPGLMLRVGRRKRSWELRIEAEPRVRKPLGEYPQVKVDAAVAMAKAMWERHKDKQPVDGPTKEEMTIALAWPLFEKWLGDEDRSDTTLAAYRHSYGFRVISSG